MANGNRGMGRGLAAILTPTDNGDQSPELRRVPVDMIAPNPRQPRQTFDQEALHGLSESISERGVIQPVLVRPCPGGTYELIAGERRWRAAQLAGLDLVPAVVAPYEDRESLELALIENMAREDLNPIEEARACSLLVDELGLTREDVGRRVGRSRVAVSNLLRLLDLPDEVLDLLIDGALTEGHGRALLMAPDHADRRRLGRAAAEEGWTVRETEARAHHAEHGAQLEQDTIVSLANACFAAEAALELGDGELAVACREVLAPLADMACSFGSDLNVGPVRVYLALAAAAAGDLAGATAYAHRAAAQCEEWRIPLVGRRLAEMRARHGF